MNITKTYLKKLIREELLKETNRADLEFLRDMKYSDVSLEDYMKIINMHKSAQQNNDTIILQYIDDMRNIPRDATSGLLFKLDVDDIRLIKRFFDWLGEADDSDFMGDVGREDLAEYIRRYPVTYGQMSKEEAFAMADQLWPMASDYFEKEVRHEYSFGPPFDLEP